MSRTIHIKAPVGNEDQPIRVAVVDSRPILLRGLVDSLRPLDGIEVIAEATLGMQLLKQLRQQPATVVISQFRLPDTPAINLQASLRRAGISSELLVLGDRLDGPQIRQMFQAGILGLISSDEPVDCLQQAILRVSQGKRFLSDALEEQLLECLDDSSRSRRMEKACGVPQLTSRELQVLEDVAHGATILQTGDRLNMSPSTVKNHRHSIYAKLGVDNAPAAIYSALSNNVLRSDKRYNQK